MDAPSRLLINFPDGWLSCVTKRLSHSGTYEALFKEQVQDDAPTLELLRELSSQRRLSCEQRDLPKEETLEGFCTRFLDYLQLLATILEKKEALLTDGIKKRMLFEWSSPLGTNNSSRPSFRLTQLEHECGMGLFVYACAVRQQGLWLAAQLLKLPAEEQPASEHGASAVTWYRRAAGVFKFLADEFLPPLKADLPADRPAELVPATAEVMRLLCLAEAQTLIAHRAGQKGAAVTPALFVGASDMLEQAAEHLKEHTGDYNIVSERWRRCLGIYSNVSVSRAQRHNAELLRVAGEAGKACASCVAAQHALRQAQMVAQDSGDSSWVNALIEERALVQTVEKRCDGDRMTITFQGVPSAPPPLPEGKALAAALPFTLEPKQQTVMTS